jgi:hypothetical protein
LSSKSRYGTSDIFRMMRPLTCWADSAFRIVVAVSLTIRRSVSTVRRANSRPSSRIPCLTSSSPPSRTRENPFQTRIRMSGNTSDCTTLVMVPTRNAGRSIS